MLATVRTLIFYTFTLYNFTFNISQKVSNICKTVAYFEVTSSGNFLVIKKTRTSQKNVLTIYRDKANYIIIVKFSVCFQGYYFKLRGMYLYITPFSQFQPKNS